MATNPPAGNSQPDPVIPAPPADPPVNQDPPVAPPPPVQPEPSAESAFSLRDAAQKQGIDPSGFDTDEALAGAMFSEIDTLQKNQAFVDIGRQFAPYAGQLTEFQKWQAEQAKAAEPTPPSEDTAPAFEWNAPEYNPQWEAMPLERDDRGFFKAPAGMPEMASIAEKMNNYRQFHAEKNASFFSNPQELINAASAPGLAEMEKRLTESHRTYVDEKFAKQRADIEMNAYVQRQETELYQHDDGGKTLYDAQGQPMLSPKGQAMAEHATMLDTAGIKDPATVRQLLDICLQRDELSGRFSESTPASPATPPSPPPLPVPRKVKQRFLNRMKDDNRAGSVPDPTAPEGSHQQNPDANFGEILRQEAAAQGVTL